MCVDILDFLGYDIDEELPWHSVLSLTRQLFPEEVFTQLFEHILAMCVVKGMVSDHTQSIDSAPAKTNASMDSLAHKVPAEELDGYLQKVHHISAVDRAPTRKSKHNKASNTLQSITAT